MQFNLGARAPLPDPPKPPFFQEALGGGTDQRNAPVMVSQRGGKLKLQGRSAMLMATRGRASRNSRLKKNYKKVVV